MDADKRAVLNPEGEPEARRVAAPSGGAGAGRVPTIGLLDNSKPNVGYFLDGIEEAIRAPGEPRETLRVTKPRSAGPSPDLALLAERCDYVINAVAD